MNRLLWRLAGFTVARQVTVVLVACVLLAGMPESTMGQGQLERDGKSRTRCIPVEVYVDPDLQENGMSATYLRSLMAKRTGVRLTIYDLSVPGNRARFEQICRAFRVDRPKLPVAYACRQFIAHNGKRDAFCAAVEAACRMTVFTRAGCLKCAKAKEFLPTLEKRYPGLEIQCRDITSDPRALDRLNQLTRHYRTSAASVPVFHFCNQLVVGFDHDDTTGKRLDQILQQWTVKCDVSRKTETSQLDEDDQRHPYMSTAGLPAGLLRSVRFVPLIVTAQAEPPDDEGSLPSADSARAESESLQSPPEVQLPLPDGPIPLPGEALPIPGDSLPLPDGGFESGDSPLPTSEHDRIELPLFGELSARSLGLPLFTLAVGLVDGFNPCAMWVLLFLLSVLVNLRDRWKILAVAGTFVFISGAAYFAFMAAWLNVFLLVGLLRWVQVTLGLLAIGVGSIHIKDFFAFRQGLSLSIPESAKPGLYARVRRIVTAESLKGAVAGAAVLAVLVNVIELLCTAGLPALYTEILTMHQLPAWQNYGYLLLYNLAYMFDDGMMVGLVVITLGRRKMQEKHGRWLKLLSGSVIAVLGLIMIVRPEWLG
ncbi:MAG: glutaredoxin family protein [Planctomycetota bacterium]